LNGAERKLSGRAWNPGTESPAHTGTFVASELESQFVIPMQIHGRSVDMFERSIDVPVSGITPAAGTPVILFAPKIRTSLSEQFDGPAKTAEAIKVHFDMRMIVNIFVIEDGGMIDFKDSGFDFVIRLDQVASHIRFLSDTQQKLSRAQIAAGMQIGRMAARHLRVDRKGCDGNR
jgi:hypothetical protein